MILLAFALGASAQPTPMEITVWGTLAEDQARDDLVHAIEGLGYEIVRHDGKEVVLKPPSGWMGRVTVKEDGTLVFGRPLIGFGQLPDETWAQDPRHGPNTSLHTPAPEAGAGPTFTLPPSKTKLDAVRKHVIDETADERAVLQAVIARTQVEAIADGIPDRLDATWTTGAPLEPGLPPLPTKEERRTAILDFWATRAETPEGRRVLDAVDAWIEEVLWVDAPPTPEELATWNAKRHDGRTLPEPE